MYKFLKSLFTGKPAQNHDDEIKETPRPTLQTDKSSVYVDYAGSSELIMVCASKWDDGDEGRTFGFSRPKAEFRKFAEDILRMLDDEDAK